MKETDGELLAQPPANPPNKTHEDADVQLTWFHVFYIGCCAHCELPPKLVEKRANELYAEVLQRDMEKIKAAKGFSPQIEKIMSRPLKWSILLKNDTTPEKQWPIPCEEKPERIHYMLEVVEEYDSNGMLKP